MPVESAAVANFFVEKGISSGRPVTLMKLLKLVYFAHGWHLAFTEQPLLDERVEAWKFGPVAPSVYHAFKSRGSSPIAAPRQSIDPRSWEDRSDIVWITKTLPEESFERQIANRVWEVYGHLTAFQLSDLTHRDGTPWHQVAIVEGGLNQKGTDIPDTLIAKFFKAKLNANPA